MRTTRKAITVAVAALLVLLQIAGSVGAQPPADEPIAQAGVGIAGVTQPLLQYQGRLTDPGTGAPKPDGTYSMSFRIYDVDVGGSALWTEIKDVGVQDGVFSTILGDVTTLDHDLFSGQELWLGIKVGTDAEAAPRQLVLPVAYALSLVPGAIVSDARSSPVLRVENTGAGNALEVNGPTVVNGNLDVAGGLFGGSHTHSGADITSSTVADARIASTIARDAEVTGAVGGHAGDADAHHSRYTNTEAWSFVLASDGPGSGLNADYLDGYHYSSFVYVGGDVMSGYLYVPELRYNTPRTHYYMVGSENFVPWTNVGYWNGGGTGGAYVTASSGAYAMVAPVHLPDGAIVTRFTAYYYDNSSSYNMTVTLYRQAMTSSYSQLAEVSTSGYSTLYRNATDTSISNATINNGSYAYHVKAYCNPWHGSNIRLKGARISYTISEAD